MVTFLLLVVGGLNWLLVGLFDFNLVTWLFADILSMDVLVTVVYVLVGLSAVYELVTHKSTCKMCAGGGNNMGGM